MAQIVTPLEPGNFYHVYNRGINSCKIFKEATNNEHFLRLLDRHLHGVADVFAWALMGNHFHLLVRIDEMEDDGFPDIDGGRYATHLKHVNQGFSNLFNAYSKAFNKRYSRTGSLFEHPFKRKRIEDADGIKRVVIYIHSNPVKHGIVKHPMDYAWTSYLSCINVKSKFQKRVVGWFDSLANFVELHERHIELGDYDELFRG